MIISFEEHHYESLVDIWYRAALATHHFVARSDLEFFREIVQNGALRELELWIECEDAAKPRGFIGLFDTKIEALFIAPEFHGQGIGRSLVQHAEQLKGPKLQVDVNEQNTGARAFYRRLGFEQVGRSALDPTSRPYPILHLARC
jgi:putative acetyltransferase